MCQQLILYNISEDERINLQADKFIFGSTKLNDKTDAKFVWYVNT